MQRKGKKKKKKTVQTSACSKAKLWGGNSAESVFQSGDSAVPSGGKLWIKEKKKGLKLLVKKELKLGLS